MTELAQRYHAWIIWLGEITGQSDTVLHIHAGMAVLVLARLLRAFKLELFGRGVVVPRAFVTTQPDRPVRFLLSRRAG